MYCKATKDLEGIIKSWQMLRRVIFVKMTFLFHRSKRSVMIEEIEKLLTPSVRSSGMFDNATWRFSRTMTMENFAFMLGSSKQGKAFLASVGSN